MKNFVFNFISGDLKKFESGEELFNLIATCLAFDQKVTVILDKTNGNTLFKDLSENKNLNIVKLEQANKFINKSDFYIECYVTEISFLLKCPLRASGTFTDPFSS